MSIWGRAPQESYQDLELPTSPGTPRGGQLYDKDLHTLVGQLLAAVAVLDKRQRAMRQELRSLTRRQTAGIGGIIVIVQGIIEAMRQWH